MRTARSLTRRLKRLPNSWVFGLVWMAAMLTMAAGAAHSDERLGALLETIASLGAPAD